MHYTFDITGTEQVNAWIMYMDVSHPTVASKIDPYLDDSSSFDLNSLYEEMPNDDLLASMEEAERYERGKNRKVYGTADEFIESLS